MKLLFGHDQVVAEWCERKCGVKFKTLWKSIGAIDEEGRLIGAAVLHDLTQYDVELSFYGPNTLTMDMCRAIAWHCFIQQGLERISIHVRRSNRRLLKALPAMGWRWEGVKHHLFGNDKKDDGILFGILRENAVRYLRKFSHEIKSSIA